eukprot:124982-Amphidinium_carterae.1
MRLGEAKNFDIQCLLIENKQMLTYWCNFLETFDRAPPPVWGGHPEELSLRAYSPKNDKNALAPITTPP